MSLIHDPSPTPQISLIVNADDFGYFDAVSRGIVHAIEAGRVTATGIMANKEGLASRIESLRTADPIVDLGVHLNLSLGEPLLRATRERLTPWGGRFPTKFAVVGAVLRGAIPIETVRAEWIAQLERCLKLGVEPLFLNSHEHLHMLPPLLAVVHGLAQEYGIPHVRHVSPDPMPSVPRHGVFRNLLVAALQLASSGSDEARLQLVGLGASGKLTARYLRRRFRSLRPGRAYELMCHPGFYDPEEINERRLMHYHDWESELELLTGQTFGSICSQYGIRLIGFRDLATV